jgi:DNA-binding transcriptional regulator LsrR (DeoR family)
VETFAAAAAFLDSILSPMAAIAFGFGPMKTMPAAAKDFGNASRSDKKP